MRKRGITTTGNIVRDESPVEEVAEREMGVKRYITPRPSWWAAR